MKKVLYIGWIGYKNLGDELMYDLFKEYTNKLGDTYQVDFANIEYRYLKNVSPGSYDLIVLGGGSILGGYKHYVHPFVIDFLHNCLALGKKIMIWGTGIDWLPKNDIGRLNSNKEIYVPVTNHLLSKIEHVFKKSVWAGVRGPLTLKVLEQYGVDKHAFISGDPAFLLDHQSGAQADPLLPDSRLTTHEKIVGVNWGTSYNYIYGQNESLVEDELAAALNHLLEKGYLIYLYSVWKTDLDPIEQLYSKLIKKENVIFDKVLRRQNELMRIIKNFTFTINLKLHANFISLGADVPFIALGYRFKVFDFIQSIHLENCIIGTDEKSIGSKIIGKEAMIVQNKHDILAKINHYKDLYRNKIKEPFENGLYI